MEIQEIKGEKLTREDILGLKRVSHATLIEGGTGNDKNVEEDFQRDKNNNSWPLTCRNSHSFACFKCVRVCVCVFVCV